MSFNGFGVWVRLYNWVNDAANGIKIRSDRMDAEMNDMTANGFGNCLTRDGQGQPTADLPMNSHKHTGVANGSARTHYASIGQLQDNAIMFAAAGGTADALTASFSPNTASLVDGEQHYVRAASANATTTPTYAPDGLTAHTITKFGGAALIAGDIQADHEMTLRYRLSATRWELLNPYYGDSGHIASDVLFDTDATYDIGKSGATRPRDIFASRHVVSGDGGYVAVLSPSGFTAGAYANGTAYLGAGLSSGVILSGQGSVNDITLAGPSNTALVVPTGTSTVRFNGDAGFVTDATNDFGKSGANRPRDGFFSRNVVIGGTLAVTGAVTLTTALGPVSGGKPSNRFSHTLTSYTPTGVAGASRLMQGLAAGASPWLLTPATTSNVRIRISGYLFNTTGGASCVIQFYYGTGAAPANGAALTGTSFNATDINTYSPNASTQVPFSFEAEVTGLTLSTQYWFDGGLLPTGGGTATLVVRSVIIEEF